MKLKTLWKRLAEAGADENSALPDVEVTSVTEDSRRARRGGLFIASKGAAVDAHDFAEQVAASGCVAIAGTRAGLTELAGLPYLHVSEPHRAAALAAHALAGDPSREMTVIGVTGTNGKSSTIALIASVLMAAGHRPAQFGTLGYRIGDEVHDAKHTTPFGEELAEMFALARGAGCTHVVMEVSSHALDQGRVAGIDFDVAAFTNLTQDHLDYHGDMEQYGRAKQRLFAGLDADSGLAVVNADDPAGDGFIEATRARVITYGQAGVCRASDEAMRVGTMDFSLHTPWGDAPVALKLLGMHNIYNALCAAAVCGGLGVTVPAIVEGLAALPSVPGRFESIDAGQDFHVVVDYAHTPDGLANVLRAARQVCSGRIICVFGCGGDRDKGKRPKMGMLAAELADFSVVTSDNPRTEDPHRILLDVEVGMQRLRQRKGDDYLVIESRQEAIRKALGLAKAGDLVLIAGKGHEDYQIIGTERIHFDDREMARQILGER